MDTSMYILKWHMHFQSKYLLRLRLYRKQSKCAIVLPFDGNRTEHIAKK